jgi:hypothetical protein
MWSDRWCVRLGEGGRLMTQSQIGAAAARCWIDPETPVLEPGAESWRTLRDALPEKCRVTEERVVHAPPRADLTTSAITILSGEFEVISDSKASAKAPAKAPVQRPPSTRSTRLTKEELRAARPPSLAPKMAALLLVLLASGGLLARRYDPNFDGHARDAMAAIGNVREMVQSPKTDPPVTAVPAPPATAPRVVPPAADTTPKMREPCAPAPLASTPAPVSVVKRETPLAGKTTAKATSTKPKKTDRKQHKRRAGRT